MRHEKSEVNMKFNFGKIEKFLIIILMVIAFILNFLFISREGCSNPYYAAAVKSMLQNFHNFFFISFDTGGYVSVDKPPLGLWIQTISTAIFGFKGWSLILPQALSGALSVLILYKIIVMAFDRTAAFISAVVLTFTPIFIATNRTNNLDSLLVFTTLLASWCLLISVKKKSFTWFIFSLLLIGTGFNIKMLQACMIVPAVFLTYFLFVPLKGKKKIIHFTSAAAILLISSLWWALVVEVTPHDKRPYVGGSRTNSVMELMLFYNGIQRVLPPPGGMKGPPPNLPHPPPGMPPNPGTEVGTPGIFRLLEKPLAGQAGWFLLISFIFPLYIYFSGKKERDDKFIHLFYWFICFISMFIYFSISSFFHRYYLVMMAPVISSLTGTGFSWILNDMNKKNLSLYNFPALLAISIFSQFIILLRYDGWPLFIIPSVIILFIISLSLSIIFYKKENIILLYASFITGILSLMIAPVSWSLTPLIYGGDPRLPFAGPELARKLTPPAIFDSSMIDFLKKHRNNEEFLIAVPDANIASDIILKSGEAVLSYGGFNGIDKVFSPEQFINLIKKRKIRFVMILDMDMGNDSSFPPSPTKIQEDIIKWILENGKEIPSMEWNTDKANKIPLRIFDMKL
jgi:4-amino-4-deoxy-L-arabinose transferase-like glycosyltransferase